MEIVVFTNGCFDILHPGHIELLKKARALGTKLFVGLNGDASVRAIKGIPRPFLNQDARAQLLKELRAVDEVYIFQENTPERLIREIKPDVLVKGGDWSVEQIVGADFVLKNGGKVFSIPFESDYSSSKIVKKIKSSETNSIHFSNSVKPDSLIAEKFILEHLENLQNQLKTEIPNILHCGELISETLKSGNNILFCCSEESRFLTKMMMRDFTDNFGDERILKVTVPILNEIRIENSNEKILNQIKQKAKSGDLLVFVSPYGNSPALISGIMQARQINCGTIGLTGIDGKKISSLCDANINVSRRGRAQIAGILLLIVNIWCEIGRFRHI